MAPQISVDPRLRAIYKLTLAPKFGVPTAMLRWHYQISNFLECLHLES